MSKKEVVGKDRFGKNLYEGDKIVFYTQESKSINSHGLVNIRLGTVTGHTNCFILIKTLDGKVTNRSSGKILKYRWDLNEIKEMEEK